MQQGQQGQTPTTTQQAQQVKASKTRRRISRTAIIWIGFVITILLLAVWIASIIGKIPDVWGINPTQQAGILTAVAAVLAAFFAFVPIIPEDKVDTPEPVALPVINITNIIPTPANQLSQSTPVQPTPIPDTFRNTIISSSFPPIPTDITKIQQRENVVKEVYAELVAPNRSSVVLKGMGGIGKSTLAALIFNYAEQQRKLGTSPFAVAAVWLSISSKTTFIELALSILDTLDKSVPDFSEVSPKTQAFEIFKALNTATPRLMVIDQFENFLDEGTGRALPENVGIGDLVDVLNSQSCACRVLLTSRPKPIGTSEDLEASMYIYPISGLTIDEGVALLRSQQIQGDEAELRQAVERCKGHGFALTLLVIMLKRDNLSLTTLLHDPDYMQLWEKDIAGRPQFLDYIYTHLLDGVSRRLLLAFAVYREPVPLEAVLPIVAKTKAELLPIVRVLLVQNLFHVNVNGNFELHPLVASYAQNHFFENDEGANKQVLQAAHAQAAQYYIQLAAKHCPERSKRRNVKDVHPLIEGVWHYCRAKQWQEAFMLLYDQYLFSDLQLWGENALLIELCQLLILERWSFKLQQEILIYNCIAHAQEYLGYKPQALGSYIKILSLVQEKDRREEAIALNNIGRVQEALAPINIQEAIENRKAALISYERALYIWQKEIKDRREEAVTLSNIGNIQENMGDKAGKQKALEIYKDALYIWQKEIKDRREEAVMLNNIGRAQEALDAKGDALNTYRDALSIWKELQDRKGEQIILTNIVKVYEDLGDEQKAQNYAEEYNVLTTT